PIVDNLADANDPGATFVQALLRLVQGHDPRLASVLARSAGDATVATELDEAFAWAPHRYVSACGQLFEMSDPRIRRIGVNALTSHQIASQGATKWADDGDAALACAVLRHVGALRIPVRLPSVNDRDSRARRYWTAWARVFLGQPESGLRS